MRSENAGLSTLPFRLDFDRFEHAFASIEDQYFHGFHKLSFSNPSLDCSFLREKRACDLLRASGPPPPAHTAWVRLRDDHGTGPLCFGPQMMSKIPDQPLPQTESGRTYAQRSTCYMAPPGRNRTALLARLDTATTLIRPFVTGPQAEQSGSRQSTLDSTAQFDGSPVALRAQTATRHANVPAMLH